MVPQYFGAESHGDAQSFADCVVTYEERTCTVTVTNDDGAATGGSGFAFSDVPFIDADGFCSPCWL